MWCTESRHKLSIRNVQAARKVQDAHRNFLKSLDEGFCYLRNNNKNTKPKEFFKWRFEISHQDLQQKKDYNSELIDYFKPYYEKVSQLVKMLHHLAAVKFPQGVSIPFWIGQFFVLCRREVSEDQIAWQQSTKSQSRIFSLHLEGALQSTD